MTPGAVRPGSLAGGDAAEVAAEPAPRASVLAREHAQSSRCGFDSNFAQRGLDRVEAVLVGADDARALRGEMKRRRADAGTTVSVRKMHARLP